MFGALINYWQYTGDATYNPTVFQALQFQVGPNQNYNPPNQSKNMGVDDQDFWAFSAMDAAEANFDNPTGNEPSWLALAQAVFNFQTQLWDNGTCGGGFRWQVYSFNAGYNLKNTISNGGFFQLAARLARYTGNQTYADWASKTWDWMESSPLMTVNGNMYQIWDNTDSNINCTTVDHLYWTYNFGTMLMGAAYMYNFTTGAEQATWQQRVNMILEGSIQGFFPTQYGGKIMSEIECESTGVCDNDESSFKAYLARWMAVTTLLAPFTTGTIQPLLQASALAAAGQCDGGSNGRMCGRQWYTTTWDGTSGVGQEVSAHFPNHLYLPVLTILQMSALSVMGANLITANMAPVTKNTGGTSKGNPAAGGDTSTQPGQTLSVITTSDKAGAGILTLIVSVGVMYGAFWINAS